MFDSNKTKAVFLTILSVSCCSVLDAICKLLSARFPSEEIIAMRFFFACLTMSPLIFFKDYRKNFKTQRLGLHVIRGLLLSIGLFLWITGVKTTMLATTTLLSFANLIFFVILAFLFLKEKVSSRTWLCTLVSFLSLFFVVDVRELSWNSGAAILLFSALFSAITDIINKKFAKDENTLAMTFYSNLFAFLIVFVCSSKKFIMPNIDELILLILLGLGYNLLLVTMLKAYKLTDANFLAPFKFFEFISAMILGFIFFKEVPPSYDFIALGIILASNIYLLIAEKK